MRSGKCDRCGYLINGGGNLIKRDMETARWWLKEEVEEWTGRVERGGEWGTVLGDKVWDMGWYEVGRWRAKEKEREMEEWM